MPKLYTPKEVAEITKLSERYVTQLLRDKKLIGNKLGGKVWRVTEEELNRFIKGEN